MSSLHKRGKKEIFNNTFHRVAYVWSPVIKSCKIIIKIHTYSLAASTESKGGII